MTDRGRGALSATPDRLGLGPSAMEWRGDRLVITVDEIGAPPAFGRLRGTITVIPHALTGVEMPLDPEGAHVWRPFAPSSDIVVDLEGPGGQWTGHGYFDANFGIRPLERDFRFWTWGRFPTADGALCFYDATRRDGSRLSAAVAFDGAGRARMAAAPPLAPFRRGFWGVRRETRADPGTAPEPVLTMLDAPFYVRGAVRTRIHGETITGVHEALDLDRFARPWMKPMLAFRVPRRARWP